MLTKTSSALKNNKQTAYGLLVTNLIVLPGVGTLMAGKKAEGIAQICCAVGGTAVSVYGFVLFIIPVVQGSFEYLFGSGFFTLLVGLGMFLTGWFWSGWTGYCLVKEAKRKDE